MYLEAVEVMEDEGQETMALDIFRQAIGQRCPFCHAVQYSSFCCLWTPGGGGGGDLWSQAVTSLVSSA